MIEQVPSKKPFLVEKKESRKIGALDIAGLLGVSLFFCFIVYLCVS
jgi:hypothetical protein